MRELVGVAGDSPEGVMVALRLALSGEGPAILPMAGGLPEGGEAPTFGTVPRAVAVVIETSGSTGTPKRVMLSVDALLASAAATSVALGGPGQWLLALPAHYVAGIQVLVRSIAAESQPVMLEPDHFDPAAFADAAARLIDPVRYTSLVPVQLTRLIDAAENDGHILRVLRRFTAILVGGQAVSPELIARAAALDVAVVRTYGSSETSGGCVYNGMPIGNTRVRVADADHGEDADAGHGNQLEIAGSVLAEGYLGDPERTASRFVEERGVRWFRTGDLGEVDQETGMVRVFGRADNVIISGGLKVSLDAVERVVRTLSGFADAVVIMAADPEWGQVPVVVTTGSAPLGLAEVRDAVAGAIGKSARPARIVVVAEIPLLASGKADRQLLASTLDD